MNLAILQARTSSTRLPNKVLKKVNNKELLLYECERILKSKKIDKLIIATSIDKSDDAIEEFCLKNNLEVFRGSLEDVLGRYYHCAKNFKEKQNLQSLNIVRITGDCPLIDPIVIDEVIDSFEKHNVDYASNTLIPTYPDGTDVEVFTYDALKEAYLKATLNLEKEHVTPYIRNSGEFKKCNLSAPSDFSHIRLTVDEKEDFELIKIVLENLYPKNPDFTYLNVVSYMSKNPYLFTINSMIKANEGYDKSLYKETKDKKIWLQMQFNKWNKLKQKLNDKKDDLFIREREIYFLYIGQNIGFEQNGKKDFLRPVLVLKKLSHHHFIGIPLTTKEKKGDFYFTFNYKKGITSYALLNQIRSFDKRRICYFSGYIKRKDFALLKNKLKEMLLPT